MGVYPDLAAPLLNHAAIALNERVPSPRASARLDSDDAPVSTASLQLEQLDFEQQRGIGRDDAARASRAVPEVRRDEQCSFTSNSHTRDPFVPAADHLAHANLERERPPTIDGAVELGAL